MALAFRLAVGAYSTEAAARFRAVFGAAKLAAKDPVAVCAAVLPADQHPLCARLVDRPRVFPRHSWSLGLLRNRSILRCVVTEKTYTS